ncbi:hypothetical protein [Streptomyces naphthomycinicus]|uniref:hypothetical protein n=1 Tax=Streptomyces naphthomycinicus TaxID=2872625 RepID=UPI001CEDE358|nr:hypothetical protein [Streptomyces sp. TML10]
MRKGFAREGFARESIARKGFARESIVPKGFARDSIVWESIDGMSAPAPDDGEDEEVEEDEPAVRWR